MSLACPVDFDAERLRRHVVDMYGRVAADPDGNFHFNTGVEYAVNRLGYHRGELESLSPTATARFAGVGNPFAAGPIDPGATVLDHACGAGTDLLIAASRTGPAGLAIGVDLTPAMRKSAGIAAEESALAARVDIRAGSFEELPVADRSVDIALSNGVLNLAIDKVRVLSEVARVLKPGGALYLADVVISQPLSLSARRDPLLWAACVGGALTEPELLSALSLAGFDQAEVAARYDCFRGTTVERKFGTSLRVSAVTVRARRRSRSQ